MSTWLPGEHLEDISLAHLVSSLSKPITTARDFDDVFIGFDRDRYRRKQELTNTEITKGKYHVRKMLKDVFGFAEHEERASYGLGYKLILTRNGDNCVLIETNATNNAKNKINGFEWYIPQNTPNMEEQKIISQQILGKITTELHYVERSVSMKEVNTRNFWTFKLGTQEGIKVPI